MEMVKSIHIFQNKKAMGYWFRLPLVLFPWYCYSRLQILCFALSCYFYKMFHCSIKLHEHVLHWIVKRFFQRTLLCFSLIALRPLMALKTFKKTMFSLVDLPFCWSFAYLLTPKYCADYWLFQCPMLVTYNHHFYIKTEKTLEADISIHVY